MSYFGGWPWFWPPTTTKEQPLYQLGVIARRFDEEQRRLAEAQAKAARRKG